jgi:hypothetical protein
MGPAADLSHGRAQLRGATVGTGEKHRARTKATEAVAARAPTGAKAEGESDLGLSQATGKRKPSRPRKAGA